MADSEGAEAPQQQALAVHRRGGSVTEAATAAGVHRATLWRWRRSDAAFGAAWSAAYRALAAERAAAWEAANRARRAAINARWLPKRQKQAAYARSCKRR